MAKHTHTVESAYHASKLHPLDRDRVLTGVFSAPSLTQSRADRVESAIWHLLIPYPNVSNPVTLTRPRHRAHPWVAA